MTVDINISDLNSADIEDHLISIVVNSFNFAHSEVDSDTRLFNGGVALNSTQIIELTLEFERHFQIELEPNLLTMENFETIGALANMLNREFSAQTVS